MPNIIKNVPRLIGSLLVWNAILYVVGTVIMTALAALSGMNWANADPQTKLMVLGGIVGTVCLNLRAYLDQTIARVAKGELPFVDVPNTLSTPSPFPPASGTVEKTVSAQVETKTVTTP